MTLTVTDVSNFVQRRLDGEPSLPMVTLCNLAGRHLVSMHEWSWLQRTPAQLRLSSGSNYVALPEDFGRVVSEQGASLGGVSSFKLVDPGGLAHLREAGVVPTGSWRYWATIIHKRSDSGAMKPFLELYPTPTASDSTSLKLWYTAGWVNVCSDVEVFAIPDNTTFELLFLEAVCALAQGIDEHDLGSVSERMSALRMNDLFQSAVLEDALIFRNYGQMRGGMIHGASVDGYDWSLYPESITGP